MHNQPCYICSSDKLRDFRAVKSYALTQCLACGHIQVNPIPEQQELLALYRHNEADSFYANSCSVSLLERSKGDANFLRNYYCERLDLIHKYMPNQDSRILDFGCTNGIFVRAILESGYRNAQGYDIAENLVEEGRKNGLPLHTGNLDEFSQTHAGYFDMILSYHVFEHLPAPTETLEKLRRCLKESGMLYINVPHVHSLQVKVLQERSPIIDPPFHLHYFSIKSMQVFFENNGFRIMMMETPFWEKNTDTFLELKGYSHVTARVLRYLVAPMRLLIKTFDLGGTISVVAKKR